jgi:hypothetical protein
MTPFQALYEYPPPLLQQIPVPYSPNDDALSNNLEKENMLSLLQKNLSKAQQRMKKYADANRTERSFQVGDFVYLKMQPFRETALGRQNAPKLSSKWYGPFKVLKTLGKSSYQLLLPDSAKIHDVFHVNQLKKHMGSHAIPNDKLPLVTEDGKVKLAPLAILQRRIIPRHSPEGDYEIPVTQWLIHWDSMTVDEATWEDSSFIHHAFSEFKPRRLAFRGGLCQDPATYRLPTAWIEPLLLP